MRNSMKAIGTHTITRKLIKNTLLCGKNSCKLQESGLVAPNQEIREIKKVWQHLSSTG